MPKVGITDTTLRDGHQSLWATRMRTSDMLPIAEKMDSIGFHSMEVWGGATFDVCMRYLDENPWERLRTLKKYIKKTPLQMLLRGQSLVGYQHYPDDVAESFVTKCVENGMDIIRVFDALNDLRNIEVPLRAGKKAGAHMQGTVVYTVSPVHTTEHYLETAVALEQMGADSICLKDMAGLLDPTTAYELVKLFKDNVSIPVQVHSHYIGGLAVGTYIKAAEAGADVIDTASVPLAFGSSQPPVETVVRALKGTPYDTGLNLIDLFEVAEYFEKLRIDCGQERGITRINDMRVFEHQVPGGMISNLISQLQEQKSLHRLPEVMKEIPKVRKDMGYPPLVTPTSQIVGTQAVLNVLSGERYKMVPGEVRAYVQGMYGRPLVPVDSVVKAKILGDRPEYTCRPADLLEPVMPTVREEAKDVATSEEDFLIYAMFPQLGRKYLESKLKGETAVHVTAAKEKQPAKQIETKYPIIEEDLEMNLQDLKELVKLINETDIDELALESNGMKVSIRKGNSKSVTNSELKAPAKKEQLKVTEDRQTESIAVKKKEARDISGPEDNIYQVKAPMVGTFYSSLSPDSPAFVSIGDVVTKGQPLCILEAMKLMNEIEAEVSGEIVNILVENGSPVEYGQSLFYIKPKK